MYTYPIAIFQRFGVELEYMIVDADTLDVRPIADELLKSFTGAYSGDYEPDEHTGWSNELTLHLIELKTARPVPDLAPMAEHFQRSVRAINLRLGEAFHARLMPTAMHPWMDPHTELRLWPHEHRPAYEAYDRIFSCKGHGWANLQSTHINLPFASDQEFARLHAAIRLILPILPALAASSPIADSAPTGIADTRMEFYRNNSRAVPSVAGLVIPERVFTRDAYENELLPAIYRDIAPLDPQGALQHPWLNARGCIARFDRGAIEIRVIDIQECPRADLAIAALAIETLRALVDQRWTDLEHQQRFEPRRLHPVLLDTIRHAERAQITDTDYLHALGATGPCAAGELWSRLAADLIPADHPFAPELNTILTRGTLSTRILRALPAKPTHHDLHTLAAQLCDCLQQGRMFGAD